MAFGHAPQHDDVGSLIRESVVPQRPFDAACRVLGVPRLEPRARGIEAGWPKSCAALAKQEFVSREPGAAKAARASILFLHSLASTTIDETLSLVFVIIR